MSPKDTRERILEVSARLFYEQGYNATGIATILREAKVNSGSLYHYFPSKEALLVGVLERYVELLRPEVTDGPERATDDPIERVFLLLANYRMGMEMTGCTMGCPIGNLALEVGDSYPDIRRLIDLNFSNWIGVVEGWLVAAGDRLPPGVDRRELAMFVLTVMEGGIMQTRAAGSLEPLDKSIAQLRLYFDHLEAEAARGREASGTAVRTGRAAE